MKDFLHEHEKDYSPFAGGQVCYHLPGASALSIKLAEKVFNEAVRLGRFGEHRLAVFDPCCGSAYHFVALGYIFWNNIRGITCSDIEPGILKIAQKNLGLLTAEGLQKRINELEDMINKFNKESHVTNRNFALKLQEILFKNLQDHEIKTAFFQHNIIDSAPKKDSIHDDIDLIFTDVPHGNLSKWTGAHLLDENACISKMLDNLYEVATGNTLLTIITIKKTKINNPRYEIIKKMKIGKRKIFFLKKSIHNLP